MDDLDRFISTELDLKNYPGSCAVMADKWFRFRRGYSALEHFSHAIVEARDVENWFDRYGNIAVGMNRVMRSVGCKKTDQPLRGDIGLVIKLPESLCIAICLGDRWIVRDDGGMSEVPAEHLWKSWSL